MLCGALRFGDGVRDVMVFSFTHRPMIRSQLNRNERIDIVNQELDALGDDHIGFSSREIFGKSVSVVGARPFSGVGNSDS